MAGGPRFRAVAVLLVAAGILTVLGVGALFLVVGSEPNYQQFRRDVGQVMQRVRPLPDDLQIVDSWEECGQGADPMCDASVLLVDDRRSEEPPMQRISTVLTRKGWTRLEGKNTEWVFTHPEGGTVMVEDLAARHARGATFLFDRSFIDQHGAEGVAYLAVAPWSS